MPKSKKVIKQTAKGKNIQQIAGNLIVKTSEDIEAIFSEAADLINKGEARPAQVLLEGLWKRNSDKMTPRQKSNCRRLIGCSFDRQDKTEEAGRCFLEAKDHDPTWEKARAFEAVGHLCLGNPVKAHELAESVLKDFSQNSLAWSVWVRTAPHSLTFQHIRDKVPAHIHDDAEVSMALAERAAAEGNYDTAEQYVAKVDKSVPSNPRVTEKLGYLLLDRAKVNEHILHQRGPTAEEKNYLEKAETVLSDALNKWQKEQSKPGAMRVLLRRAWVRNVLLKHDQAKDDIREAYHIAPEDPQTVFWYAVAISEQSLDDAIALLKKIVGSGYTPDVEFLLGQMLQKRNSEADIQDAVEILKSRVSDLIKGPHEFRVEYLSLLLQLQRQVEGMSCATETLDNISQDMITAETKNILRSELLWLNDDKVNSIKTAKDVLGSFNQNTNLEDKRKLASLLQMMGLHKEALRLWKDIVRPEYIGKDTYHLMEAAQRCEDAKFVIEFSEKLRHNGLWDKRIFDLELYYREIYNDDEGAKEAMMEYIRNPQEQSYTPYIRARLSALGIRTGWKDLIERDPEKLPKVKEVGPQIGRLVATVLRYGGNQHRAVEYAYELLRLNWESSEAHLGMIEVLSPIGPKISVEQPESVAPGIAVRYKEDDTNVCHWHIVENSSISTPMQSRNEYALDHPISQAMLGKKSGDSFFLRKDSLQDRTATIQEIHSKYDYRYSECFENFESRFPHSNALRKFIAIDKTGKFDISPMQKLAEKDAKHVKQLEEIYSTQLVPIYWIALKKGRSIVEAMNYVAASPSLELKCCIGNDQEESEAEKCISSAKEIVLDASAIVTLMFSSSYEHIIKAPFKFIVSQGTLSVFRHVESLHGDPDSMAGSYSVDGFRPITPEDVMRTRDILKKLISFIESNFTIIDGLVVAELEKERRDELIKILGRDCAESILLATQADRVLWTDDLATAALAQNKFGCYRIWTQFFFNHLLVKGLLDNNIVQDITVLLMQMGYYYTKPTIDTFMVAVEKSNNDIDQAPAFQVFNWFSDPTVNAQGQFYIAAGVIKKAWQDIHIDYISQHITIRILERLSQRPKGYFAIEALKDGIRQVFGLDVANAKKARDTIEGWLRGTQGKHIILP